MSPKKLAKRFVALGDMTGMTFDSIVSAVGSSPMTYNRFPDGSMRAMWGTSGFGNMYSITLAFDATARCMGVVGETNFNM